MADSKTLVIISMVLAIAVIVAGGVYLADNDNAKLISDDNTTFNATFEAYSDASHPSTVVKYVLDGNDITGKTLSVTEETVVNVTVTSSETIYGMAVNFLPIFDSDDGVNDGTKGDRSDVGTEGNSTYTMDTKIMHFGDYDVNVTVSPYYNDPFGDAEI